jgi:xanthine dehydrogenase YagS FAD-binding subunit
MPWQISIDEPRSFEVLRPTTIEQAVELGGRHGVSAAYLAGGCDLVEQLKQQWSTYRYLINLKSVPSLRGMQLRSGSLRLGALTTLGEIERSPELHKRLPALAQAAARVATPQIRNMGTVGGNLLQDSRCPYYRGPWCCYRAGGIVCDARHGVHAEHAIFGGERCITVSPSDLAPALVALDASAIVFGPKGMRQIPIADLFLLPKENIRAMHRLGRDEVLAAVEAPLRGRRSAFVKYAIRNSWDFAIVSAAVALDHSSGVARQCRVVLGAVAPAPWRSIPAEQTLEGQRLSPEVIKAVARAAVAGAEPLAQNEYKVALVRKAVAEALTAIAG